MVPKPRFFLWIPVSAADSAAVNPNGIKTLLANGVSTFLIIGKLTFTNGSRNTSRNTGCTILDSWVFDNFILADKLFAKAWRNVSNDLCNSNNSCGKLVSLLESPIILDEHFRVTSIALLIADLKLRIS